MHKANYQSRSFLVVGVPFAYYDGLIQVFSGRASGETEHVYSSCFVQTFKVDKINFIYATGFSRAVLTRLSIKQGETVCLIAPFAVVG